MAPCGLKYTTPDTRPLSLGNSNGLRRLTQQVRSKSTQDVVADLSTLMEIVPYEPFVDEGALADFGGTPQMKLRIFNHSNGGLNDAISKAVLSRFSKLGLQQIKYSDELIVFRVTHPEPSLLKELTVFVGTQSLEPLPTFSLTGQYASVGSLDDNVFPPPHEEREYPLVGLIDSGTDPDDPRLQRWVERRDETDVPREDQDHRHASFIAGLLANARGMNPHDGFPDVQSKIVDIVVMPKDGQLYEDDLLNTIRRAVDENPDVRVWNLSLANVSSKCDDNRISEFAMALDEIQSANDILFVNCAGNTDVARPWPATPSSEADRILSPGESVRCLTVGSVAHLANANSVSRVGEPSPFSRRGPGLAFMPKPEIAHFGGNCDRNLNCSQTGVVSTSGNSSLVEAIGTSFSTPLVATLAAGTLNACEDPLSINMAKALIVHSAALNSRVTTANELKYRGFGVPGNLQDLTECKPWQATMLFEPEIPSDRRIFSKVDFPIPECFRREDGRLCGGFMLTAVYDPPLSKSGGFDYCRANVEVSLGKYDSTHPDSDPEHKKLIPLHPKDFSDLGEKALIENGFKWSPVKVFQDEFKAKAADRIRLYVRLFLRDSNSSQLNQNVAIVASLYDPKGEQPVYDQTMQQLNATGWQTQPISLRNQVRQQLRG